MFQEALELLRHVMQGFAVQEDHFFSASLTSAVEALLRALKDPALPLMEMQVCDGVRV